MNLLSDEYNKHDFEILKNILYEQNNEFILPIMLFILQNSDVFTEDEIITLKETAYEHIKTFNVDNTKESEYIYSSMILNYADGYNINDTINYIYNKLKESTDAYHKITYLYYYILLVNNDDIANDEYLKNILNDILTNYSIQDKHLTEIYYLSYLINYFKVNNSLEINEINFLQLLIADLNNVHSLLSIYDNLDILSKDVKNELLLYYTSMYNNELGFGTFVSETNSNLNYATYLLLRDLLDSDLPRLPQIDKQLLSEDIPLKEDTNMKLMATSSIQLKELGGINNNLKTEVISRLKETYLNDDISSTYYLFLIAYNGKFINQALQTIGLNEPEFEKYLVDTIKNSLIEKNTVHSLMYLDILSSYHPNNEELYNIYNEVKDLFYGEFLNYVQQTQDRQESIYSSFSLLKTIELRIGLFDDNDDMIEKIFKRNYVGNFLIIHGRDINNLKSYYQYYYVSQLYTNKNNANLNFVFMS